MWYLVYQVHNMCNIVRDRDYREIMTKSMESLGLAKYTVQELRERL